MLARAHTGAQADAAPLGSELPDWTRGQNVLFQLDTAVRLCIGQRLPEAQWNDMRRRVRMLLKQVDWSPEQIRTRRAARLLMRLRQADLIEEVLWMLPRVQCCFTEGDVYGEQRDLFMEMSQAMRRVLRIVPTEEVLQLWRTRPTGIILYSALLDALFRSGQRGEALALLDALHRQRRKAHPIIYNYLMDECVARGDLASASQWLEAMLDGGDSGNDGYCSLALLNAMLHASIYQRGVAVALRLFGTMLRHGVANRVTCNIAMQACRVAAMLKGAAAIKKYMERRDALLHPDEVTYGTLLGLYCERGMLEQCMELRAEMAERGVPMSAHAVHALIGCALHAGQVQAAWALYKEHVRPQLQTVVDGAAAAASTDDGDVDRNRATAATAAGNGSATASDGAAAVGNRGRRMQQRPFPAELFVNALRACSRLGLADEAERVFQEMQPYQCTPSSRAHNALLAAYVRADRFPEAFAAIRSLRQRQLTPHPRVLQTLAERLSEAACRGVERTSPAASDGETASSNTSSLDGRARQTLLDSAFQVLNYMQNEQMDTPLRLWIALVCGCAAVADLERAFATLERARVDGQSVDAALYDALLNALSRTRNVHAIGEVVRHMRSRKVPLSADACTRLVTAFGRTGDRHGMLRVFGALVESGVPLPSTALREMREYLASQPQSQLLSSLDADAHRWLDMLRRMDVSQTGQPASDVFE
ncbi:hypothetical protein CDCA_CDCA06G1921 [Cyanidium caldarium]|uniref:Pentatricopeptide repeat-containing protein-mitochondrial domain-containing protein n=1 Tax=Cyanidium caldarium TaxID=2771 RepID=A0AAV9IUR8_CYACA|nr:hypothetical protein CDCA_CDCA06G1921 [Cyanidium caldarium]